MYYLNSRFYNPLTHKELFVVDILESTISSFGVSKSNGYAQNNPILHFYSLNKTMNDSISININNLNQKVSLGSEFNTKSSSGISFNSATTYTSNVIDIIATVLAYSGYASVSYLNNLTSITIKLNAGFNSINFFRNGTLGGAVKSSTSMVAKGLIIAASTLQVISNFTNPEYELHEMIAYSSIDVGLNVLVYYLIASSPGGLVGLGIGVTAFVLLEVFDVDKHLKSAWKFVLGW